ncbi:aspartate/glutamate racemase family protein [Desulfospira joergensenii]|uniref:aspartate/glutamate racemase family protein n=1 Tax=Desulfospira joergensenii TaxID=53329 RepID=UPI0003B61BED|nr:aspartate/glutamate racemase family protein [Desulfospira joergensenii]
MIYHRRNSQVSYGEAIGILLLDSPIPFIPGDVANATSYDFPVRFKKVEGFTVEKALAKDPGIYPFLLAAALDLEANGVRAVTGDCGFMALHQEKLKQELTIPVFLSSLLQIPFMRLLLPESAKIGILTASAQSLTPDFLEEISIAPGEDLKIRGLETCPEFSSAVLEEKGSLDPGKIQKEVTAAALDLARDRQVKAILLECSVLPPYAATVHEATGLPVFDYATMINTMFSALVPRTYDGYM